MSSATSTDLTGSSAADLKGEPGTDGLRPWQFFVLAGMLAATATVIVATGQSPASIIVLSATVLAASLVGLGAYRALIPLVSPEAVDTTAVLAGRARLALEREKALVLRSIKELEFDRAMGKVGQTDYDEMSERLRARAIGLMRQLDSGSAYREIIEREVQARAKAVAASSAFDPSTPLRVAPSSSRDDAPPLAQARARDDEAVAPAATIEACSECGITNDRDAKFCKNCGTKLT
jgi:hypothetical protein